MTKPSPIWLNHEQRGNRSIHLNDSWCGVVIPAEPSAHQKLLADPLSIYAELLALAGWGSSGGPQPTTTLPAQSQAEIHGLTERIPFRCLPPFMFRKFYGVSDNDWMPLDCIWIDGGKIRIPECKHEFRLRSLFWGFYNPEQELLARTEGLVPPDQLKAYEV